MYTPESCETLSGAEISMIAMCVMVLCGYTVQWLHLITRGTFKDGSSKRPLASNLNT